MSYQDLEHFVFRYFVYKCSSVVVIAVVDFVREVDDDDGIVLVTVVDIVVIVIFGCLFNVIEPVKVKGKSHFGITNVKDSICLLDALY